MVDMVATSNKSDPEIPIDIVTLNVHQELLLISIRFPNSVLPRSGSRPEGEPRLRLRSSQPQCPMHQWTPMDTMGLPRSKKRTALPENQSISECKTGKSTNSLSKYFTSPPLSARYLKDFEHLNHS